MNFKTLVICAACLAVSAQAQNHDPATNDCWTNHKSSRKLSSHARKAC